MPGRAHRRLTLSGSGRGDDWLLSDRVFARAQDAVPQSSQAASMVFTVERRWDSGRGRRVVVGGGSAGCVVSARLAESASLSVLLLEAGPDRRVNAARAPRRLDDRARDVRLGLYRRRGAAATSPAQACARRDLLADSLHAAGRTGRLRRLGVALGLPGWSWEDVLPSFVELECDLDFGDRPWHGDPGRSRPRATSTTRSPTRSPSASRRSTPRGSIGSTTTTSPALSVRDECR